MDLRFHETGDGPSVLFLPGWNTTAATVASWIPEAFLRDFRCRILEWPGLGRSSDDPLPGDLGALLDALAAALPGGPVDVVGFCLGGAAAWTLAQRHPSRVGRVVLVESLLHYPAVLAPLLLPGLGPRLAGIARGTAPGRFLVSRAILGSGPYPDAFLQDLFRWDPQAAVGYLRLFRAYAKALPLEAQPAGEFHRLEGDPLAVLALPWGRRRPVSGPVHRLPGAGHFPAVEAPDVFFATLARLLKAPVEPCAAPGTP